jgi:hypothetical protein
MADNALAKQVGKKMPERRKTRLEQIADEIQAYGGRVRDDFMAGAERSAQGLGDIVERGDVLTGIPRLALGGTAWMGAPVSAALSPILNPILQPVGEAVNTYVGQPVEDLTGYPADITNDLAMTGLTLGAVKGLGMTRPYLARAADQVEGMANRAGYTLRKPANVYGSGPTLTPLVDDEGFTVYHGTGKENADAINKGGFKIFGGTGVQDQFELPGISTTPNKSTAQFYAAGENYLTEADRMDPFVMELRVSGSKSLYPSLSKAEKEFQGAGGNISDIPAFLQFLKGRGYKGVTHDGEVRVFDPADIKVVGGQPMQYQDGRLVNGSGPMLTRLADDADNGLTRTAGGVSSVNAPGPNAGEAIDATNLAFRVHPTDSQVAGSMKPGAAFSDISHKPLAAALEGGGFKIARIERSASNTETFGPSISQYLDVEAPNGTKFKVRLSDHSYVPRDGQVDLRYGMSPEEMQLQLMRQSGMEVPRALSDTVAKQAADADAARIATEQLKAQQFADEYRPKIDKALADVIAKKGEAKVLEKWDLVKRQAPGARAARQALEAWGVPPDVLAALHKLK